MKSRIWMVALLIIVGIISAAMLGVLNVYTEPIVTRNKEVKFKTTVLGVFGVPCSRDDVDEVFEKGVDTKAIGDDLVYYEFSGKDERFVAFEVEGAGFWAPISAIIALESDLETIKDFKILAHLETPGLGARIVEPWFQTQFRGKKITPRLYIVPHKDAKKENKVDAITGATETSKALEEIINKNAEIFLEKFRKTTKMKISPINKMPM